jgi:hypothetical protein
LPFPAQAPFAKNCAGPAASGSIPLPSLRCGLPAACALAPLAYGSRLSLRSAQGCITCSVSTSPSHSPRPPTPKKITVEFYSDTKANSNPIRNQYLPEKIFIRAKRKTTHPNASKTESE